MLGAFGGVTPVHRVSVPEVSVMGMGLFGSSSAVEFGGVGEKMGDDKLKENVNPLLNGVSSPLTSWDATKLGMVSGKGMGGFEFSDHHPFTMKTLDAYVVFLRP